MTDSSMTTNWTKRILKHVSKVVKRDDVIKELALKTATSAYSDDPLNLFLTGISSSGKTNAVKNTIPPYFPKQDVWLLGGLSPTALVHSYGTLIDTRTGLEIDLEDKPTKESFRMLEGNEKKFDKESYTKAMKEWRETLRNSAYRIDLTNKIIVFLEAPHPETYARLRPILSHDVPEISYKFTDKKISGLRTVHVILRGWPATIFCTTKVKHMSELSTRSLTANPEMIEEKYHEANILSGNIAANPWKFNPKNDKELNAISEYIHQVSKSSLEIEKVVVPYGEKIGDLFPHDNPSEMRHVRQFLSLIKQNAILNLFNRSVLNIDDKIYVLANLEDLERTIGLYSSIADATSSGVPQYILDFYSNVFIPVECEVKNLDENNIDFNRVRVGSLVFKHNEVYSTNISSSTVYVYLKALREAAIIDSKKVTKDGRRKIYFSLTKRKNSLNSLINEYSSFFSETDFKKWLESTKDYHSKIGVKKILFAPSIDDLHQRNNIDNLLDEKLNYTHILLRYLRPEIGDKIDFKIEKKLNNIL